MSTLGKRKKSQFAQRKGSSGGMSKNSDAGQDISNKLITSFLRETTK